MCKILIIEDNKDVNFMLYETLSEAGYKLCSAYTGIEGVHKIKNEEWDLILLDIMLPFKSGDAVLKEVREFSDVPVIIISAKDMVRTKIDLLKLGADDYITKPFDLEEVAARVETLLRRVRRQKEKEQIYTFKELALNGNAKRFYVMEEEVELTAKEYLIMELFLKNQDKIFTKAKLYETIWEEEYLGDDNTVKTHISNLRNKLKNANSREEYIETVWGLGYRLNKRL
ncbi:response regulator transcription factor [Anaerocolumna xylanovorans]|uniref:Stage 0 sporulation protein A homolog n=1 Tax=Anaerocolumna xylanovorans DSM 12503 TaxID=1121345 RepID=A0A1M7Y980_9FIRM|nr:response regulator transcription factor [Anaerocolumna xylanovorans]SHO49193.1 DNA-binding response regulator, OmpR family, contains REC and winged-helix (wHTH) domain [Anaerocolumna xylanovorans DSM 12503]